MPKPESYETNQAPAEALGRLFLRFLRFGLLAWGGPVAQIGMIRQELVDKERWISPARFNRVLAVYQVMSGPEAHELCVYFGMLSRGRTGAFLGGLGFMLPGFALMFALSWLYATYGLNSPLLTSVFSGLQVAVVALIVRATYGIGRHALTDRLLWAIAIIVGLAHLLGVSFIISLPLAGLSYSLVKRSRWFDVNLAGFALPVLASIGATLSVPSITQLFFSGLRSGLLTFGGAYTVIPFLHNDAVVQGAWMTNAEFLDGLALSSVIPAPLVIFGTFVGYIGGGTAGSIALTLGIFLPAFAITMVGHSYLERLIGNTAAHAFLDGVTAGVVGLISATAIVLIRETVTSAAAVTIFLASLLVLYRWKAKISVAVIMAGAALAGLLLLAQ